MVSEFRKCLIIQKLERKLEMKIKRSTIIIGVVLILIFGLSLTYFLFNYLPINNSGMINEQDKVAIYTKISSEVDKWIEDIKFMNKELEEKHYDLYHSITKEEYAKETQKFIDKLPDLSDIGRRIEVKKLISKIGDGHTSACENIEMKYFPIRFYTLKEGYYVANTIEQYKDIIGYKLVKIGNTDVNKIINDFKGMISSDNKIHLNSGASNYLNVAEILKEYGYIDNILTAKITFKDNNGKEVSYDMNSLTITEANNSKWVNLLTKYPKMADMLYLKNTMTPYWYMYLEEHNTMYFQYNICKNNKKNPLKDFIEKMVKDIEEKNVQRFIFDMRNNGGGNSKLIEPLIEALKANKKINKKGNLYVVIGKSTFSSAILNAIKLKNETEAILIGRPTGGRPNHYGEIKTLDLPNSKMRIIYSTKYFNNSGIETESLNPDIEVEYTFDNFVNAIDPVLKAIIN